ncbi:MAG: sugar ABC transporter permease [Verrucomicrobia bacterium]|nr:MAG: sugar ABC transporter permease [Verrucomicrobiota bacterium]
MAAKYRTHSLWVPYVFLAPFLLVFSTFVIYPLLQSVVLATQQTFGPGFSEFVFLDNFKNLLGDPIFWIATRNTFVYAAASVVLLLPLSLSLAMMLNRPSMKGRGFFRLIFFSPALVGAVFVGVIFGVIFQKRTGLLNNILYRLIGFDLDFPWIQDPRFVMPALIIASLWMWVGFNMIYFLAALQNVDKQLEEAATIDGANSWQKFIHVTVPAIRPIASFVVLLSIIGAFQLFELPWMLLNQGPGPERSGLTIVMNLYQTGFQTGDLGYASAIGWVLALILVFLALFQRRMSRSEET